MRQTLHTRHSSAVRGRASRSLIPALPALPDSIRKLYIRLDTPGVEVTDFRVQVDELYLINVFCTCLQAKEVFISKDISSADRKAYSCAAGTMHISLRLMCS